MGRDRELWTEGASLRQDTHTSSAVLKNWWLIKILGAAEMTQQTARGN